MNFIVRYGPAPEDTADANGVLHSTFTGFLILRPQPSEIAEVFGTDGTDGSDPEALVRLAAAAWAQLTGQGHGHMLIGACSGFEFVSAGGASCGFGPTGDDAGGYAYVPKDYVPLYAVARGRRPENAPAEWEADHVDIGIDYRGTEGPGDETIQPVIFNGVPSS